MSAAPESIEAPLVSELDLRDLPAPEPLLRALIAADALAAGDVLHVLTPLMPWPLLQALCERGLLHHTHDLADHGVRVVIERPR
jgi:TusA-related sulfurtransferase